MNPPSQTFFYRLHSRLQTTSSTKPTLIARMVPIQAVISRRFCVRTVYGSPTWLKSISQTAVQAYRQYLDAYASEQQQLGRFQWKPNNRLRDVTQFLDYQHVVPSNTRLSLLVALGLLIVCLVNTVALLLAKFLGRSGEIAVRRALGASRSALYAQFLTEAAVIGAGGGLLGLLFTAIGVLEVGVVMPAHLAALARIDPTLLMLTLLLAVTATLLAAIYPTYRASRVPPALQLKTP